MVWPRKNGARWQHCARNTANSSKWLRMFKTGQSTNEKSTLIKVKSNKFFYLENGNLLDF
jgi:hypothetical protein